MYLKFKERIIFQFTYTKLPQKLWANYFIRFEILLEKYTSSYISIFRKLMYISMMIYKVSPSVDLNYYLKSLDTLSLELTNQYSLSNQSF